jgi:hypothetical protein
MVLGRVLINRTANSARLMSSLCHNSGAEADIRVVQVGPAAVISPKAHLVQLARKWREAEKSRSLGSP